MKKFLKNIILIAAGYGFCTAAFAYVYIDIGDASVRKSQMALQPPVVQFSRSKEVFKAGSVLFQTLKQNFSSGEYFKFIPQEAFLEKPGEKSPHPYPKDPNGFRWKNWQLLNTDYLVLSQIQALESQKIRVHLFLYHIPLRRKTFQKEYIAPLNSVKKLGHIMSNNIVESLTGSPGVFLTKIAAVRSMQGTKKEIFTMDFNGQNKKQVSFHKSTVLSPVWSPQGKHLSYTAYLYNNKLKKRNAALLLYNRLTRSRRILSNRAGVNIGSDFAPDGQSLLATLFLGRGDRDIVRIFLKDSSFQTLTRGPGRVINVEPVFHPGGKRIVFSSDRGGRVMLYSMNTRGRGIRRLTYQGSYNSTPDFSPEGKQVVFSGRTEGRFDLFLMNADGSGLKRLTSVKKTNGRWANNESPSFSPDGRFIVFSSNRDGPYQLYTMNIKSLKTVRITKDPHHYKSPQWSPFLK